MFTHTHTSTLYYLIDCVIFYLWSYPDIWYWRQKISCYCEDKTGVQRIRNQAINLSNKRQTPMVTSNNINAMTQHIANMIHIADANSKTKELTTSCWLPVSSVIVFVGQRRRAWLRCLHCLQQFENLCAMVQHSCWCPGHYKAYCVRTP